MGSPAALSSLASIVKGGGTMIRSNVVLCAVLVFCLGFAGSASAVPFIIDDFDAPNPLQVISTLSDPNPPLLKHADANILGGERDLLALVDGTPRASTFIGELGDGEFIFAGASPGTSVTLTYDGSSASPGIGGIDLYALGSALQLDFTSVDVGRRPNGLEIEISVRAENGDIADFYGEIPSNFSPSSFLAELSAFGGSNGALHAADQIVITLNPYVVQDVDFTLDTISVVPEPSTIVGLLSVALFGLVLGVKRRRTA